MISPNFIWLALVVTAFGNYFYIRDTLRGQTQPNRVTFFLWGAVPLVTYFAQRSEGAGVQIYYTLIIALMPLLIFASSFVDKKAYWKITKFDLACGALSVVALVFLLITGKGIPALILSLVADFFAALPTIIKSYKHPESETPIAYMFEVIGSIVVLLTIQVWIFVDYIFPAYILFMCVLFTTILLIRGKQLGKKVPATTA